MYDLKVRDVMTHLVVTLRPSDTIQEAARRFSANRISGAPVVDAGYLVGIVSVPDLVKAYVPASRSSSSFSSTDPLVFVLREWAPLRAHEKTIGEVMTRDVLSISPEASVWEAAVMIDRYGVKRLPVIDLEGYVLGIVARSDLIRAMAAGDHIEDNPLKSRPLLREAAG